jgi:hypothetical protein
VKINIGDYVIPVLYLGKVVKILPDQVVIEYKDAMDETRYSYLTETQAVAKNKTLDQLVDDALIVVLDLGGKKVW